ncbi:MAG: GNAT family N-acetyltransferase [Granulosicoccus sp.]
MKIVESGEEIAVYLEEKLLSSLRAENTQAKNSNIVLSARDSDDQIIGGLVASTSYSWLLIKILWVEKHHRGAGIGRSLMERAETSARTIGCHSAWLDTSSSDSCIFYLKLGYMTFAELKNSADQAPPGHERWFMKKSLNE